MWNVVLLAAGYGTRLEKDLLEAGEEWKALQGIPKPLLPVGGVRLLTRWIEQLRELDDLSLSEVVVVHNTAHASQYHQWAREAGFPASQLVDDGTTSNETRRGALRDLEYVLSERPALQASPLLVVAGDTLFMRDFSLRDFVRRALGQCGKEPSALLVPYYLVSDAAEVAKRGIVEWDATAEGPHEGFRPATGFLEKPRPESTESRAACPPLYMYSAGALAKLQQYLRQPDLQKSLADAPGSWLPWLVRNSPGSLQVFGPLQGRWDIGSLQDYVKANLYFSQQPS